MESLNLNKLLNQFSDSIQTSQIHKIFPKNGRAIRILFYVLLVESVYGRRVCPKTF